jgi:hypothetical protein
LKSWTCGRRPAQLAPASTAQFRLGGEFLMSSAFTVAEIALARLGLAALGGFSSSTSLLAGLTLVALHRRARKSRCPIMALVIDALAEVIDWHKQGLLPLGKALIDDPRCRLVKGDFLVVGLRRRFRSSCAGRQFDAVLAGIDHSPRYLVHPRQAAEYSPAGLRSLPLHLHPGGSSHCGRMTKIHFKACWPASLKLPPRAS